MLSLSICIHNFSLYTYICWRIFFLCEFNILFFIVQGFHLIVQIIVLLLCCACFKKFLSCWLVHSGYFNGVLFWLFLNLAPEMKGCILILWWAWTIACRQRWIVLNSLRLYSQCGLVTVTLQYVCQLDIPQCLSHLPPPLSYLSATDDS